MSIEPHPNFKLVIGDGSGTILNGDVPVRWCIDRGEFWDRLTDMEDPHILLITIGYNRRGDLTELPRQQRTVKLYAQYIKNAVCKPRSI